MNLLKTNPSYNNINLRWIIKLRWGAFLGQVLLVALTVFVLGIRLELFYLFIVLLAQLSSNAALAYYLNSGVNVKQVLIGGVLGFDVVALTFSLLLTGGSVNPFTVMYLVYISLSSVVLNARYTWMLVGLSLLCFAFLYVDSTLLRVDISHENHMRNMELHLQGMWLGFLLAATFIGYFVTRVQGALSAHAVELEHIRKVAARGEELASLATLAAGAAHELATPLGTIAIAAKDLELELRNQLNGASQTHEDLRLIRNEVKRCRCILDRMAAHAGESSGQTFRREKVQDFISSCLEGLPRSEYVQVVFMDDAWRNLQIEGPIPNLEQAFRGVVKNAIDAGKTDVLVEIKVHYVEYKDAHLSTLELQVRDKGCGMSAQELTKLGEPFYTTKEVGVGMGLGIFLARSVLFRVGGTLCFSSEKGCGTTAYFSFPVNCNGQNLIPEIR